MKINVAKALKEDRYFMYVTDEEGEELGEFEITKEYFEASLKEFNREV